MPDAPTAGLIAHAIQIAIAPVLLLTGIAGLLNVMATRLARVIDRARTFEFFGRNMRWAAGGPFVVALLLLILGLACFLREVYVATHTTSFDPDRFA
jgi:formate-dependent nitrite reductase membrane component NrfD